MSRFLYYVPKCGATLSQEKLDELGLSDRIDKPLCRPCRGKTPDGGSGAVVIQHNGGDAPIMDMDNQTWRAAPKGDRDSPPFWIGFASADPPGPDSLRRGVMQEGNLIKLEGGSRWSVPVIRNFYEGDEEQPLFFTTKLPQMVEVDDNGNAFAGGVTPQFQTIWDESLDIHDRLFAQLSETNEGALGTAELYGFAAKVIGINYRVTLVELAMLSAMSTADTVSIVRNALDLETYEGIVGNVESRSELEDTDTPSGPERQKTEV